MRLEQPRRPVRLSDVQRQRRLEEERLARRQHYGEPIPVERPDAIVQRIQELSRKYKR